MVTLKDELELNPNLQALTINGPWAWAIIEGHKRIENRSWVTEFPRRIAIHAGQNTCDDREAEEIFRKAGIKSPFDYKRGAILGTVEIVDIIPCTEAIERYKNSKTDSLMIRNSGFCWILKDPRPCERVYGPGQNGLWYVNRWLERNKITLSYK